MQSIEDFNYIMTDTEALSVDDIIEAPPRQRILSCPIDNSQEFEASFV